MPGRWLTDLATSIADGASIDWAAADARATDSAEHDLIARLKVVETITRGHASATTRNEPSQVLTAWGPFAAIEFVGRGTFGDVYRAWDARLDRPVALKLLRRRELGQGVEDSAVIEEARLIARVRHPHVVTVHGAERIDGRVGVWMEFLEGRTLEAELQATGPFSADAIVAIGLDLSSALAAVHRAGLLHRDVKAQNVIRDASGRSVLTDFGSGREFSVTATSDQQMELAGTPLYLAPEVVSGAPASPQSEVYSLGVLLYHLATGTFPARGRTLRDLRDAYDRRIRTTCREAAPALPANVAAVIDRALEQNPAARFPSADSMNAALRTALAPPRRAGHRAWWIGASAAAVTLAVLVWWLAQRNDVATPPAVITRAPEWRQLAAQWMDNVVVGNPEPNGQWLICVEKTPRGVGRVGRCDPSVWNSNIDTIRGIGQVVSAFGALVSSDGARVAYVKPAFAHELRSSGIDGLGERIEYRFAPGERMCELASWSWEGDTLAGCVMSADGSSEIVALSPASPNGWRGRLNERRAGRISLSPDAQSLVYDADADEPGGRDRDLFVIDLRTGADRPLTSGPADDVAPVWSADSRTIYFASNRNNAWAIWSVRSDAVSEFAAKEVQELGRVRRVTALGNRHDRIVYRLDYRLGGEPVDVHTATIDWAGRRLDESAIAPISASSAPAWSPDGQRLAYLAFDGHQYTAMGRVLTVDALHRGPPTSILITNQAFKDVALRWAPDGKSLVACCGLSESVRAWLIDLTGVDGPGNRPVDFNLPDPVRAVAFSSSSTSLFYSTTGGIWSHDLSTTTTTEQRVPASREILGDGLELSPDGLRLAFDSRDSETRQSSIRTVPVGGGKVEVLHTSDQTLRLAGWTDENSIIFLQSVTTEPATWELRSLSLGNGTMKVLPFPAGVRHVRLHPDGRHVAYSIMEPSARLWVLGGLQ